MRGRTNAVSGTVLPELSNPAGAANIQSGYQAINGAGEVVTGTARVKELVSGQLSAESSQYPFQCYYSTLTSTSEIKISSTTPKTISALKNSLLVILADASTYMLVPDASGLQEIVTETFGRNYNNKFLFVYRVTANNFSFHYNT